jgi:hypothetical protein
MVFVCTGFIASGTLFAGGAFQWGSAAQDRAADTAEVGVAAEVAEVAEVADTEFFPRQNPAVIRAGGSVSAISGIRGVEINEDARGEAVDIVVNLPQGETFSRGILEGEDVSAWIENLPAGLEARSHGLKRGATIIRMYISGVPTVTGREAIRVTIPGTYLTGGNARQFVSPTEEASQKAWADSQTE